MPSVIAFLRAVSFSRQCGGTVALAMLPWGPGIRVTLLKGGWGARSQCCDVWLSVFQCKLFVKSVFRVHQHIFQHRLDALLATFIACEKCNSCSSDLWYPILCH